MERSVSTGALLAVPTSECDAVGSLCL